MQFHTNYLADWAHGHQSTAPEAAEGDLDEVRPRNLSYMAKNSKIMTEQIPHGLSNKRPEKILIFKSEQKKILSVFFPHAVARPELFRRRRRQKKKREREQDRELTYAAKKFFFHTVAARPARPAATATVATATASSSSSASRRILRGGSIWVSQF